MTDTWYHWAPTSRRNSINRKGLVPGQWSTDRLWKPPYVCLADSPSLAWSLSGMMPRGLLTPSWDLWEVWTHEQKGYEIIPFDSGATKEIRVYERIYKRNVWFVAQRSREVSE